MLQTKTLTLTETTAMIEQLEAIVDMLFAAGHNTLGNNLQDVVYGLEAQLEPTE